MERLARRGSTDMPIVGARARGMPASCKENTKSTSVSGGP